MYLNGQENFHEQEATWAILHHHYLMFDHFDEDDFNSLTIVQIPWSVIVQSLIKLLQQIRYKQWY